MRLIPWVILGAVLLPVMASAQSVDYEKFIAEKAPSIVTVKMVVVTEINGREIEREVNATGVVVDKTGLVMFSAEAMNAANRIRQGFGGRGGRGGGGGGGGGGEEVDIQSRTENIRVRIPGKEKEHSAALVATDSELNIAFVQIESLGDIQLSAVEFEATSQAKIGDELIGVGRLGQEFDHAPFFGTVRVTGSIEQPRKMFSFDGRFAGRGIPLFSRTGKAVGILAAPAPPESEDAPAPRRGGRAGGAGGGAGAFLIPASTIHTLIGQAKTRAAERSKKPAV